MAHFATAARFPRSATHRPSTTEPSRFPSEIAHSRGGATAPGPFKPGRRRRACRRGRQTRPRRARWRQSARSSPSRPRRRIVDGVPTVDARPAPGGGQSQVDGHAHRPYLLIAAADDSDAEEQVRRRAPTDSEDEAPSIFWMAISLQRHARVVPRCALAVFGRTPRRVVETTSADGGRADSSHAPRVSSPRRSRRAIAGRIDRAGGAAHRSSRSSIRCGRCNCARSAAPRRVRFNERLVALATEAGLRDLAAVSRGLYDVGRSRCVP